MTVVLLTHADDWEAGAAMNGQVAGHFTGPHGEPGQYNPAQVERAEQDMKIAG